MSIIGGGRLGVYRYVLTIFIPGYMSSNTDDTMLLIRVENFRFFQISRKSWGSLTTTRQREYRIKHGVLPEPAH